MLLVSIVSFATGSTLIVPLIKNITVVANIDILLKSCQSERIDRDRSINAGLPPFDYGLYSLLADGECLALHICVYVVENGSEDGFRGCRTDHKAIILREDDKLIDIALSYGTAINDSHLL